MDSKKISCDTARKCRTAGIKKIFSHNCGFSIAKCFQYTNLCALFLNHAIHSGHTYQRCHQKEENGKYICKPFHNAGIILKAGITDIGITIKNISFWLFNIGNIRFCVCNFLFCLRNFFFKFGIRVIVFCPAVRKFSVCVCKFGFRVCKFLFCIGKCLLGIGFFFGKCLFGVGKFGFGIRYNCLISALSLRFAVIFPKRFFFVYIIVIILGINRIVLVKFYIDFRIKLCAKSLWQQIHKTADLTIAKSRCATFKLNIGT